jgi:hypothetical protein
MTLQQLIRNYRSGALRFLPKLAVFEAFGRALALSAPDR